MIVQEDYASFELTRVLKQKGYPLVKVVKDNGDKPLFYDLPKDHPDWSDCEVWYKPTLYQVQKWLDTQHGILVSVGYAPHRSTAISSCTQTSVAPPSLRNPVVTSNLHVRRSKQDCSTL